MKSDAWAAWVAAARPNIEGFTVDAIVIPASSQDKGGFARDTWVFQLTRKGFSPRALWISLKAQHCGIALLEGKGPAKAPKATLPVFLQKLKKEWIGKRITAVSVYPQERFIRMVAGSELVLIMIPAKPDAYWRDVSTQVNLQYRKNTKMFEQVWEHPWESGSTDPSSGSHLDVWQHGKDLIEALQQDRPKTSAQRRSDPAEKRAASQRQIEDAIANMEHGPDWYAWGEAMQLLWTHPDYQTKQSQADLVQTIEACFDDAKKLQRKLAELKKRLESLKEKALAKTSAQAQNAPTKERDPDQVGLRYRSSEGRQILVGRNAKENREITVRLARGNDLWFHVKGRPGAHGVVISEAGKTASLETLLDAAVLVVVHSKGLQWGRTEVDYTFRKYVKTIPDKTGAGGFDVTYSQNKTLIVDASSGECQARLKRLSQQNA